MRISSMRTSCALVFTCCLLSLPQAKAQSRPAVIPPKLITMPRPDCSSGKSCHRAHGDVRLVLEILEDGKVGDVSCEVGESKLIDAAIAAAQQAEFTPGTYLGEPKNMNFVLRMKF